MILNTDFEILCAINITDSINLWTIDGHIETFDSFKVNERHLDFNYVIKKCNNTENRIDDQSLPVVNSWFLWHLGVRLSAFGRRGRKVALSVCLRHTQWQCNPRVHLLLLLLCGGSRRRRKKNDKCKIALRWIHGIERGKKRWS